MDSFYIIQLMEFKTWSRVIREVLKESNIDHLYSIILDELSSIDACNNVSSNLNVFFFVYFS